MLKSVPPRLPAEPVRAWRRLAWAMVVLGALIRLHQFVDARFLWLDEAMLALNIGLRGPLGLLQPLEMAQTGPVLHLWLLKACALTLGMEPWSLRLPALLGGLLLPLVMWRTARHLVSPAPAVFATALTALAPGLILYSRELKPYGLEALLSLWVLATALSWRRAPHDHRAWRLLAAACLINAAGSIPGILVVAAVIVALLTSRRLVAAGAPRRLLVLGLAAAGLFGLLGATVYLAGARSEYMQSFWQGMSLAAPIRRWPDLLRGGLYAGASGLLVGQPSVWSRPLWLPWVARICSYGGLLLGVTGLAGLVLRGRRTVALLLGLPFVAVLVASLVAGYPLAPRLLLFLAPQAILLLASGLQEIAQRLPPHTWYRPVALGALALAFLGPSALRSAEWSLAPPSWADAGPVLEQVPDLLRADDVIYVASRGFPVWLYATSDWRGSSLEEARRLARLASPGGTSFHSGPYPGAEVVAAAGLATTYQGHRVLVGASPGIDFNARDGFLSSEPARGWAADEAERLQASRASCALLVSLYGVDSSLDRLLAALRERAWTPRAKYARGHSRALRVCHPGEATSPEVP